MSMARFSGLVYSLSVEFGVWLSSIIGTLKKISIVQRFVSSEILSFTLLMVRI